MTCGMGVSAGTYICEQLGNNKDAVIAEIAGIIRKAGGKKGLADIHDEIEKIYRNEKGPEIYRKIRQNIGDICGQK